MQYRGSRQMATGLTVNDKVNIRAEYYRAARAMCQHLFTEGSYRRLEDDTTMRNLPPLDGILQHIYRVKNHSDRRKADEKKKEPIAARTLYRKFLFYKNFVTPARPLFVTEGKTDVIYLIHAIRYLPGSHPRLGKMENGKFINALRFLNYTDTVRDVLQLGGGTGDLSFLINEYRTIEAKYGHRPMEFPVIIVVDNDAGAREKLFGVAKSLCKITIMHTSTEAFYHLSHNLYLVKTPSLPGKEQTCIEDFFPPELLTRTIDDKPFDPNHKHGDHDSYSKQAFAESIIKPQATAIDFQGFVPLLDRIVAALDDFEGSMGAASPAAVAK